MRILATVYMVYSYVAASPCVTPLQNGVKPTARATVAATDKFRPRECPPNQDMVFHVRGFDTAEDAAKFASDERLPEGAVFGIFEESCLTKLAHEARTVPAPTSGPVTKDVWTAPKAKERKPKR